jgi:hypothetical protein
VLPQEQLANFVSCALRLPSNRVYDNVTTRGLALIPRKVSFPLTMKSSQFRDNEDFCED